MGAAFNPNIPSMYPNYQAGRMGGVNTLAPYGPPNLYPGFYSSLAYAYGGLGLPPPGTLLQMPDQSPSITASAAASYPQPILGQQSLTQGLPTTNLGVGMLTGQALSQGITHPPLPVKESPKTAISSTITGTTQSMFPSIPSITTAPSAMTAISSKAPPVNVVITSSDPLPMHKTPTSQPILSHIKGGIPKIQPHNYQIPLPSSSVNTVTSTPSILSKPAPAISTQSLLSNVAPPVFSAVSQHKSPQRISIEKTLDQTFSPSSKSNISLNKSNASASSIEEHDPCPDFKPIIPLPDEVPINTGEECEVQLFCERAKLFRHVSNNGVKEWKERGVGNLKILSNPETGKVRLLMRRDQVHKICANHFVTKDMALTPMASSDRAYVWAALDFADEAVVLEKFCVRFKSAEEAKKFYDVFESAKKLIKEAPETGKQFLGTVEVKKISLPLLPLLSLGGFVFTNTPSFKPKDGTTPTKTIEIQDKPKSPFSNFTFGKSGAQSPALFKSDFKPVQTTEATTFSPLVISQPKTSTPQKDEPEDECSENFVPTAEFKPVVALPDLVEVKTGEENSEILFESRAKLFRYDTNGDVKEWKERGVGTIKILKDDCIRLLMRRDQVHKVCCNHMVLKNMSFKVNSSNPKAIVWHAQDFSEGVLTPETFTVRFKTEEQASQFLQVLQSAQTSLDENNKVSSKHHKPETRPRSTSFGDKFKPAKGSWECKNCYIVNEGKTNHCVACETPKSGSAMQKPEDAGLSGPVFSFGISTTQASPSTTETSKPGGFLFGQKPATDTWGNAFKPAEGSWECKTCCVRNSADKSKCALASLLRMMKSLLPTNRLLKTPDQKFTFGVPATTKTEESKPVKSGFGDAFKPKAGSWECEVCLVRNNADVVYCVSCETPKDDTVSKKETNKGINLETPGQKFTFGMPQATTTTTTTDTTKTFSFGPSSGAAQFSFGSKPDSETKATTIFKPATTVFSFKPATTTTTTTSPIIKDDKFVFGSPQKHDFEFKPRSPRRISAGHGDEESDGSYVEEEEDNIYFKPVIPLPDKVEVKTGEEDEEILYCHRAKLFRFVGGEWKERGLGDIKILKRKNTGKLRVVMRREQVLKICLNHILTRDIDYITKDEKTWLFHAADFSEGELTPEQFCVRFKNSEIAQDFRKAITNALEGQSDDKPDKKGESPKEDTDDEVQIVSETQVTSEEEQEALRLGLPPKFLSYRQLPDCTCEQCKKDDEYLKELFAESKNPPALNLTVAGTQKSSSSSIFTTPASNVITPSTGDSLFVTPKEQTSFSFSPATQTTKTDSLRDLLLKPSKFDASSTLQSQVSTTPSPNHKRLPLPQSTKLRRTTASSATTPTGNIFTGSTGGLFSNSNPGNIFGGAPGSSPSLFGSKGSSGGSIFGNAASTTTPLFGGTTTTSTPIFGAPLTFSVPSHPVLSAQLLCLAALQPVVGISLVLYQRLRQLVLWLLVHPEHNDPLPVLRFLMQQLLLPIVTFLAVLLRHLQQVLLCLVVLLQPLLLVFSVVHQRVVSSAKLPRLVAYLARVPEIFSVPVVLMYSASLLLPALVHFQPPLRQPAVYLAVPRALVFFGNNGASVFGNTVSVFGTKPAVTSEINATVGGAATTTKQTTTNLKEDDEVVLKCNTEISFASLAANTSSDAPAAFSKPGDNSFAFLGAGAPVFGGKKDAKKKAGQIQIQS
ncbi:hypothetical protein NQ318_007343 [Aromia moschata]|uniref:Nuclear pore complex protein Nup153 n=1 Tax=Aromia moschata TaxID=1265417 RepID=A0AAV8Z1D4_9CUCU|nr:hypothetical protein NQ318_007343 [Aromia moschata]